MKSERYPSADFPSCYGHFRIYAIKEGEKEHVALVRGDISGARDLAVRMHSQCLTGDTLGSLRCDCGIQLIDALQYLGEQETGVLFYLNHEGRGIGLFNKIRAYSLQDGGADTVEANHQLGFKNDLRDYSVVADFLNYFDVRSVRLITNNPLKVEGLEINGIDISGRVPLIVAPNEHNSFYLETKRDKMNHYLG